jgi:excisionase family DNA binding protein
MEQRPIVQRFVSIAEAATYTGLGCETIRRKIREGTLRAYRPVRKKILLELNDVDMMVRASLEPVHA